MPGGSPAGGRRGPKPPRGSPRGGTTPPGAPPGPGCTGNSLIRVKDRGTKQYEMDARSAAHDVVMASADSIDFNQVKETIHKKINLHDSTKLKKHLSGMAGVGGGEGGDGMQGS